jgi:outer membrane protein OmpA-like peptidoglycan-associated protein
MKTLPRILLSLACLPLLFLGAARAQEPDAEGCKDPALFNRMPGYRIQRCDEKDFDAHSFKDAKGNEVSVEGHVLEIHYSIQEGAKEASRLQLFRNYQSAVTKIGGTLLSSDDEGNAYLKVVKEGKEIWVHVSDYITSDWVLYVVEKQAMNQDIVADAAAFAGDLKSTGHTAVYGIYFDTGSSVLKPESEAALGEIAKLLQGDAALKLHVVGHTDNVGTLESNLKLSQARGEAVVQALVTKHGIAAARLRAAGVGPLAPVASNDAEEGRAKNRRVELVKQ